ncbi:MAG: YicC family protein [Chlamydiae bacterium RIFCSPHIGHO2_12_FULL_49_9]|nr:MAG: YicC family protein [Chlamydiae bacterium RIFCSPHIGHO2_12_FULL_49_9]
MPSSMTGFGRAVCDANIGRLVVEIQSVNRKYLEVFVSLPKEFSRFENEVRKWVGARLSRGQVSIRIHFLPNAQAIEQTLPDVEVLRALKKGWEKIALEVGVSSASIDLPFLVSRMPSFSKLDSAQDEDLSSLKACVEEALESLTKMKKIEGKALVQDIRARLESLTRMIREIEALSPEAGKRLRQKLKERIEEILKPDEVDDRLLRELALFAEKVDVSEEITRFHSHLEQFKELISSKEEAIGRKMDFLVQEMGREINTVASKSSEPGISRLVVDMKSELEKIREQIQNIE